MPGDVMGSTCTVVVVALLLLHTLRLSEHDDAECMRMDVNGCGGY